MCWFYLHLHYRFMSQNNRVYLHLDDISMLVYVVICAGFTYTYIINPYVGVGNV